MLIFLLQSLFFSVPSPHPPQCHSPISLKGITKEPHFKCVCMYVVLDSRETLETTIDIAILSCLHDSFVSGAEITTGNVAFTNKRNGKNET